MGDKMQFIIEKASFNDAKKANDLLTKLIIDEKKYDKNINEKCIVSSLYEKFYNDDNVCLLVAKTAENIIGYLYGYIDYNDSSVISKVSKLDALFVLEGFRGHKVASELISLFKKWSYEKGAKYVELTVCIGNEQAAGLYEKLLFKPKKIVMSSKIDDFDL